MPRSSIRVALVALLAGAGLAVGVPQSAAQTAGPVLRAGENRRIGNDTDPVRGRDGAGLAVNPADPRHIVESEVDPRSGRCHYNVSFDGGITWTGGRLQAPADFGALACLGFNQGGYLHMDGGLVFGSGQNVYVAFDAARPGNGDSTLVARSTDGGRTFAPGQVVFSGGPGLDPYFIRPKLGVLRRASGDRVVVEAWGLTQLGPNTFEGQQRRLLVSVSENSGATWSPPVDAQPVDQAAREISPPVIAPNGTIYIGWRTQRNTANGFVAGTANTDYLSRSTDGGRTWTSSVVRELPISGANHPRIALDPTGGTIYYVDNETKTTGDPNVWFQRSTDGGVTWSPEIRLNDDPAGTTVSQGVVNMAVAPNGRIDVIWSDRRFSYGGTSHYDIFMASSADGGRTFGPNRRVTDRTITLNTGILSTIGSTGFFAPTLTPLGNDATLVAWPDSRTANFEFDNQDIYASRVEVNPTGPPPVTTLPVSQPAGLSSSLSRLAYPGGSEKFGPSAPVAGTSVVIVNESDVPAALAGSVLARANLGPLLASPAFGLTPDVAAEVTRLAPVQAYLIGDEGALSSQVVSDLIRAGVPADRIVRIAGTSPADTARRVAELYVGNELGSSPARTVPTTAVVVNPASGEAPVAAALAASLRYPVLFTEAGSLPAATAAALEAIGTTATLVIGGPGTIADNVLRQLPSALRVGGADLYGSAVAVLLEGVNRGLPLDEVYVVDGANPIDGALAAAYVARLGGALMLAPGADAGAATAALVRLGLLPQVDELTVLRSVLTGPGYRLVASDGGVFAFGGARFLGSTGGQRLARPVVATTTSPSGLGYWLVASDGGVFSFGDAAFAGSTGALRLNRPVVGMAPTPSGKGYWLVASDGGVFAFGDAAYLGSTGALRLNSPIVGIAATPSGRGYFLVASDGGVFGFGDAVFRGSTGALSLNKPIVAMAATPSGRGYFLVASDGGVFGFGDAVFRGSTGALALKAPIVGISTHRSGGGYWLVASDGGVFAFGPAPFLGSTGALKLAQPVVAVG
ncbi:MAG: cell wall-binding repeat-containing protein [Acidimicrobiales bacterium]